MDLKTNRNALRLLRLVLDHEKAVTPILAASPQKAPFDSAWPLVQPLPRTSPEEQGISSERIGTFLQALRQDDSLDPHSIMILRNGAVIAEADFGAYDHRIWHITHSACKSITGLAVGMLIGEGRLSLDNKIVDIFEEKVAPLAFVWLKNLTVRHLLTMSSGVLFSEAGAVTEKDWVKCFLESMVVFEPGSKFYYNSMNTYMLSAIVREVSGQGLMAYLDSRLWQPLGITGIFWETCPMGNEKGGWGLYIRQEDFAKIGQLVLQGGCWNEQQLIPAEWIAAATSNQIETPQTLGNYNYGYQTWVGRQRDAFLFNGMFGQNVLGFRDNGLLLAVNSGNDEFFQQSHFFSLAEEYFPADLGDSEDLNVGQTAGQQLQIIKSWLVQPIQATVNSWLQKMAFESRVDVKGFFAALDGTVLLPEPADGSAIGILPLLTQLVQNNFTRGLKSLAFRTVAGELQLTVNETDESHHLPIGFDQPLLTDLVSHGETYRVAASGQLTTDEDDNPVLKIRISFLEIANARLIKLRFCNSGVVVDWQESPGKPFFEHALALVKDETKTHPIAKALLDKADNDYTRFRINRCIDSTINFKVFGDIQP